MIKQTVLNDEITFPEVNWEDKIDALDWMELNTISVSHRDHIIGKMKSKDVPFLSIYELRQLIFVSDFRDKIVNAPFLRFVVVKQVTPGSRPFSYNRKIKK